MGQNRGIGVFLEGHAAVGGIGHKLGKGLSGGKERIAACCRIVQQNGGVFPFFQSCHVVIIRHGAAGVHGSVGVGIQGFVLFRPVQQICRRGMAPVHIAPAGTGRVMLVEHVVHAVCIYQTVGVVVPAVPGCEVDHGTQKGVVILFPFPSVRQKRFKGNFLPVFHDPECQLFSRERMQIRIHPHAFVPGPCQKHIQVIYQLLALPHNDFPVGCIVADIQTQIPCVTSDFDCSRHILPPIYICRQIRSCPSYLL